jgi:hypothetical protein
MEMKHKVTDVRRYNDYAIDVKQFYDGAAAAFIATVPNLKQSDFESGNSNGQTEFEKMKQKINESAEKFAFAFADAFRDSVQKRVEEILNLKGLYTYTETLQQIKSELNVLKQSMATGSSSAGMSQDNTAV